MKHGLRARRPVSGAILAASIAAAAWATPAQVFARDITPLPELQSAVLLSTTTAAEATTDHPAGTVVTFAFDEPISGPAGADPDPSRFLVYESDGTVHRADSASISGDSVTARYDTIDAAAERESLTAATSLEGAVEDGDGYVSPVSSVAISRKVTVPLRAGRTSGADLMWVGNFRTRGHLTTADFRFDRRNWFLTGPHFRLHMVDGTVKRGVPGQYSKVSPSVGRAVFLGRFRARDVARATVDGASLAWKRYTAKGMYKGLGSNAMQAVDVSHHGNTPAPDLVEVRLRRSANGPDHAIYVFDQPVVGPLANRFTVYTQNLGGYAGRAAARVAGHPRLVRVTFDRGWLNRVVAATVRYGAVQGGGLDEVGTPNTYDYVQLTDAKTSRPDLLIAFPGQPEDGSVSITFEFDQQLNGEIDPEQFHFYGADGTSIGPSSCSQALGAASEDGVVCSFPTAGAGDAVPAGLATVSSGGVQGLDGQANREGSFAITSRG